jgi:hypothetical protein
VHSLYDILPYILRCEPAAFLGFFQLFDPRYCGCSTLCSTYPNLPIRTALDIPREFLSPPKESFS